MNIERLLGTLTLKEQLELRKVLNERNLASTTEEYKIIPNGKIVLTYDSNNDDEYVYLKLDDIFHLIGDEVYTADSLVKNEEHITNMLTVDEYIKKMAEGR